MAHPFQAHRQTKVEHDRVKHIAKGYADGGAVAASDAAPAKRASGGAVRAPITGRKNGGRLDRTPRKSGGRIKRAEGGSTPNKPAEPKPAPIEPGTDEWLVGRIGKRQGRARGGRTNAKKGTTNVNVIIAPQSGDKMPGLAAPMPGGPPMMPPKPPMPMMPPGGAPGLPPGGPPPSIRHDGGRAYASGGAVKFGPAFEEGKRNGTQVSHSGNKSDGKDIGRPKPVTYASGGPVEVSRKGGMGPKLSGGARGGIARLEKERRI